eukprot:gb/GEZN01004341.1/.p1 GENE.gb/GEZN01004341.1/~~gb/GEZN01004341.1/.p1  ORF type:complete len:435 (-),score=71.99 gb/GEZN01004341.1/:465-1769(-)
MRRPNNLPTQKKKKKDKHRDKSRSGSRGRDRDRERRKKKDKVKAKSRSRSSRREKRKRSTTAERELKKKQEEEREADRDSYTVFVTHIHPKVDERDLFEFFSHVGKVEDIRLIRDQRTYKSKGLAYVEFWEKDCVGKAIALTGQALGGYPITIALTPTAEKAKEEAKPMRLYVGSLHEDVAERDLRPVFEAFGTLEDLELQREKGTNKTKGFGFVTYKSEADARQALSNLDGLEIAGRPMKVSMVTEDAQPQQQQFTGMEVGIGELDDMGGGGFQMNANSRVELMRKLQRGANLLPDIGGVPSAAQASGLAAVAAMSQGMGVSRPPAFQAPFIPQQPSTCIIIKNMFNPAEEKEVDFHLDIQDDVSEEVSKYGKVKHCFADKNSAGHVYLKFDSIAAAHACVAALHGRWFASRQISAEFMPEVTYHSKFPKAAK